MNKNSCITMLSFFMINICALMLSYTHIAAESVDNNVSNQKSVGEERLAATVDGYNISLSQVDEGIYRQVLTVHENLSSTASLTLTDIIYDNLKTESKEGVLNKKTKQIDEVLRNHRKDIEQLVKNDKTQSQLLKERIAEKFLESKNREEFVKKLLKLQKNNKLTINIPLASKLESPLSSGLIIANMEGFEIHAELLEERAALKLYRLRGELYLLRKKELGKIIEQYLLKKESENRGMTIPQLEKQMNSLEIEDRKVDEYISQQKLLGNVYTRAAVKPYLEYRMRYSAREQLVTNLKNKSKIAYRLESPERPRFLVNDKLGSRLLTYKSRSYREQIDIFYFSNYRCDQCRKTQQQIQNLMETHPEVSIKYLDFVPLTDPLALNAAILVRCSGSQGKYNEMRSLLMHAAPPTIGDSWFDAMQLNEFIKLNSIEKTAFSHCLDNVSIQNQVAMETKEALRFGFREPPAFVISGKPLSGLQTTEDLMGNLEN